MRPLDGATYTVKSLRKQNYGENQKNKKTRHNTAS